MRQYAKVAGCFLMLRGYTVKRLFALSLILLVTACTTAPETASHQVHTPPAEPALPDGVTFLESLDKDAAGISIPYAKYRLDNGLTVILHKDHSDPMVHVDVTYHVGSNREEPGRSGFAHFFEHMMFEGSENVADEEHSRTVSNAGGSDNGSTNSDRTNYFETLPANQLETALWLEADRMGLLLPAVTQEKFEIQRETVKNERGQRVDNQPYGRVFETLSKALYPPEHPYSWPVIGWIEDLNRADLDDLKRFFLRWYGPNNATLTIGGDIDPMATLAMVTKYFGPIPAGPAVEDLPKQPARIEADRYLTLEDNIHLPAIALLIPTVYSAHEDEAALDAAAEIMGGGQDSLLYQSLVQTGRAVQAYVSHSCRELACEMYFVVIQNPGSGETLAEMENAIRETISNFARREVNADDLQKFKAQYESDRVFGLQSVRGKVATLAAFETYQGTPAGIGAEIERYLGVETSDVKRVFDQYIDGKPAVILSIVPNGQPQFAARTPNHLPAAREIPENYGDEGNELPLRPVVDNFDRSQKPVPGANPIVELPPIGDNELANGLRALVVLNDETPTMTVRLVVGAGQRDEPAGKAGLAALTAALMGEATTERSAAEFTEELKRIGASIRVRPGEYDTSITLNVLTKHLDRGVELLMERMLQPAFTEADFDRIRQRTIEGLIQQRKSPEGLADRAVGSVLYGPAHPLSYQMGGLPATVGTLTLDDVKDFYATHIPAHFSGVLISSSLSTAESLAALSAVGRLPIESNQRGAVSAPTAIEGRTVYLVDKADAAQSSLHTVQNSLKYDALGDLYRGQLMNFSLGATGDARLFLNLREDKGYTYGIYSYFAAGPEFGSFRVSGEVNKDATAASITEVLKELKAYATEGMTESEFEHMRNAIGQRDALRYETPGSKLGLLNNIMRYDLPLNYRTLQKEILQSTDRETLNALAQELITPDHMAIVVVGDEAVIGTELEALGMPIVKLDEDGFVIPGAATTEKPESP
jgi:zinc protease